MSIKFLQTKKTTLSYAISDSATTIQLDELLKLDGTSVAASDIGDALQGTFAPGTAREEIFLIDGANVTVNSDGTVTITNVLRGRKEVSPYGSGGFASDHGAGEVVVFGNNPQLYNRFPVLANDNAFTGNNSFTLLPTSTGGNATSGTQLITYAQALAMFTGGTGTIDRIVVAGTAGETLVAGNLVYVNPADGRWWKCDADTAASVDNVILGIAQGAGTAGNPVTSGVLLFGLDSNQTGLTANVPYYAGNTAGAISSSVGTVEVSVGFSQSTTTLYFYPRFNQQITEDQQDALAGTSGTPSATNKYVTADDVSSAAASGKIVRATGTALPALDGTNLTGVAISKGTYTASGAISQNDTVYVSAANTVKSLYPSAQGTGASIATAPTTILTTKSLPLSTNGTYLNIAGGYRDTSGVLYAQVRTINAGETDFSNGTQYAIYNTGNGVRWFDVCSIGTDKFLFIFQADTGGAAAGIKAVVATVSSGVVTVGTPVTVETTGSLTSAVSCAKVDTDKGIIFYKDDSGNDIYMKVLTVSGTTITQNTAALVKTTSSLVGASSVQLGTNSVAFTYSISSSSLFGVIVTVSGTTPTAGAEQTIISATDSFWHKIDYISSTKLLLVYEEDSTNNTFARTIAISGATMTASSSFAMATSTGQFTFGTAIIGTKYALVFNRTSATNNRLYFLDVSGTTPTEISNQNLSQSTDSGLYLATCIVKISPWTYMVTGSVGDGDYIVKLTPASSARIGVAESAISDASSGNILNRYLVQTLSGITLTPGSIYYIDDTGQPTVNSSLTSPTLGIAISTTKILLQ